MSGIFGDECFDRRYLEDQIQKAFLRGLKQGRSEGYDNGFDQGDFQGFNRGRKQGYNDGFNDGEDRGYQNGYAKGYDNCKEIFDSKVQQAFENGNQNGYEKGFQAGHDKCEEEFNGSYYILLTTTVTRADASTETMATTNFKTLTANAETMTDSMTFYDLISIENEPENSIPTVISDISLSQTPSSFATVTTDDFIPLVQKSPHLCLSFDNQRSKFKGVLSAPRFNNSVLRAHFRQIFDQDRCSQPADIKGLLRAIRSGFFRRFSFARFEHRHGSTQAPRSGYFSRWRMTSHFRKTCQACGSMSQFRLSSIADQALHVCSSTSTHAHSHQALHSTSKRSRLRVYVKGNSSFHFNLSHSTPTRIPDRRQSTRLDFRTFTSESEA